MATRASDDELHRTLRCRSWLWRWLEWEPQKHSGLAAPKLEQPAGFVLIPKPQGMHETQRARTPHRIWNIAQGSRYWCKKMPDRGSSEAMMSRIFDKNQQDLFSPQDLDWQCLDLHWNPKHESIVPRESHAPSHMTVQYSDIALALHTTLCAHFVKLQHQTMLLYPRPRPCEPQFCLDHFMQPNTKQPGSQRLYKHPKRENSIGLCELSPCRSENPCANPVATP